MGVAIVLKSVCVEGWSIVVASDESEVPVKEVVRAGVVVMPVLREDGIRAVDVSTLPKLVEGEVMAVVDVLDVEYMLEEVKLGVLCEVKLPVATKFVVADLVISVVGREEEVNMRGLAVVAVSVVVTEDNLLVKSVTELVG